MRPPRIFPPVRLDDYELLDCGAGEKLERVGPFVLRRPDPQAMWSRLRPATAWEAADLVFVRESDRGGRWEQGPSGRAVPAEWEIEHEGAHLIVRPTPFKHIGVFPEQSTNWAWVLPRIRAQTAAADGRPAVLNLFAHTGAATILAARAGAFVTHVDSSRPAMRWANANAERSGLRADAVRWITDDALGFVTREVRRGSRYAGILLDPPPYGRGPKNERWVFEEDIVELLLACRRLLAEGPAFLVLSCYAVGTSPLAFANMLEDFDTGAVEAGELVLPQAGTERLLPAGLCGRWWRE